MRYFGRALYKSLTAGFLVLSVWCLVFFLTFFGGMFFLFDLFTGFPLMDPLIDDPIIATFNITFWGIAFVNLPVYIIRRNQKKKKLMKSPFPKLGKKERQSIMMGFTLLPGIFAIVMALFSVVTYRHDPYMMLFFTFLIILPIFIVWCTFSMQRAIYMMQDEAMKLVENKENSSHGADNGDEESSD